MTQPTKATPDDPTQNESTPHDVPSPQGEQAQPRPVEGEPEEITGGLREAYPPQRDWSGHDVTPPKGGETT